MPALSESSLRPKPVWTVAHVLFLALVWAGYSLLGLNVAIQQVGPRPELVGGYALFFLYSTGFGFAFHRQISRRDWLQLPLGQALWRIALGVGLVGALQALLVYVVQWAWTRDLTNLSQPGFVFVLWFNSALVTGLTTSVYCTVSFFHRLSAARRQAKALEASANAARLTALEAQMNPHFLFNALNSLRGMIGENPAVAQDMVTRLANILRHSLARDPGQPCRFQEEFETVQDYLSLEGIRFDERLQVSYRVDESVSSFSIPALSLQTLVENAVKHGIAPRPEGGRIVLSARQLDANLWEVVITNPGRLASSSPGTRVGLRNLRERLYLLYGDRASFTLSDSPEGTVRAALFLPIIRLT